MKAQTLDKKFDAGDDISMHLDWSKARRLGAARGEDSRNEASKPDHLRTRTK
jgi:hypothetical protein